MKAIRSEEITAAVEAFLREGSEAPSSRRRERSWDFCFNHFQDHARPTEIMDLSCLHLGYYLASWGMMRGSSFLFRETNARHYQRVIGVIEQHNEAMRGFDVPAYRDPARKELLDAAWDDLREALVPEGVRSLTLVSKVMMGVWGCVPSFDTFFLNTFKALSETKAERGAFNRVGVDALACLADVYEEHAEVIEELRQRHTTWDMGTGQPTGRPMTRAKVLDIYGFQTAYARAGR